MIWINVLWSTSRSTAATVMALVEKTCSHSLNGCFHRRAQSLIDELLAFSPAGGIDDQVDAFCQGVLWIEGQYWRGRGYASPPVPMVFSR